ncbi:YafY family transcriptional regulator [Aquabacterium sp. A7-Y]|uniref:helix-turn-helix transcriptional regulator n=1 Tax=Aquabacterium sp. A7-Y TaxID=1349605 RepID=UPI00223D2DA8|nr:YafY family protein [Aquabacterium sp. A7-Y]MCW7540058.1 YafY family transcriptional regulator [Aquabacterium sp. A7-Y]
MRRAERLFELVQLIRSRRLSTAAWLATRLEVSERTIYRDIVDLQAQGVPIEGEAGVGYRMRAGYDLPPLMFSSAEAQALVAAVRLARGWLDPMLARQAEDALGKIMAVLPPASRVAAESLALYAPPVGNPSTLKRLAQLREAIEAHVKLRLSYQDMHGARSDRTVRPLGCFYWGKVWTLGAWCEARDDFRSFRLDRIAALEPLAERFRDEPGRSLADLFRLLEAERCEYDRAVLRP